MSSFAYNGLGDRYQQIVNSATTTYQLDLAAGLVNVLADGDNTYLYGNTVVAQVSDTQTGYYLPDVLGSVRQMTSPTGEVQLSQRFTPFGEVKEKFGDGEANFGYTAQQYDAQTGLLYLRARYYAPGTGRFISHDTWSGDANMPMSYNAWLYGYGNPVRYVDPSGMIPENVEKYNSSLQYDLTGWIPLELNDWVNNPIVLNLRSENQKIQDAILASTYCDSPKQYILSAYFTSTYKKVMFLNKYHGGNAVKDIKVNIKQKLKGAIVLCTSTNSCRWVDYSVPGNILFGYIRNAIDAPKAISDPAGGVLEFLDNFKNWTEGEEFEWELEWVFGGSCGDNPEDYNAVTLGEELWDKYEDKLDRSKFEQLLKTYLDQLQSPIDGIPTESPIWQENQYSPGEFDNE